MSTQQAEIAATQRPAPWTLWLAETSRRGRMDLLGTERQLDLPMSQA